MCYGNSRDTGKQKPRSPCKLQRAHGTEPKGLQSTLVVRSFEDRTSLKNLTQLSRYYFLFRHVSVYLLLTGTVNILQTEIASFDHQLVLRLQQLILVHLA